VTDQADDPHREFILAALRVASARAKLMDNEIMSIGVALRGRLISPEMALKWANDMGLLYLMQPIPQAVEDVAMGKELLAAAE
jgi:hypothetical protein